MKIIYALSFILLLAACAPTLNDYRDNTPIFSLRDYFSGELIAYGMLQDHQGQVIRRFTVKLSGQWQQQQGVLHEEFIFDDGEEQTRIWYLTDLGNNSFTGTAADVSGTANGSSQGNTFRWQYSLIIPYNDSTIEVFVDDWMFQLDEKRVLNRSQLRKFGVTVAEITLYFEKVT